MPWLVNPVLAALSVLLAHAIASRMAGRDQADLVAMMMGASPWLLAMSASLMTHTLTLFLMLLAWWLLLMAGDRSRGALRRIFTAGLAMLYGALYFILLSEQNALLMGSLLLFGVIASVMIATRKLDWHALLARQEEVVPEVE